MSATDPVPNTRQITCPKDLPKVPEKACPECAPWQEPAYRIERGQIYEIRAGNTRKTPRQLA
jgi:hypothetical protein